MNVYPSQVTCGMQESQQQVIELSGVEPHLFKLILDYLYGVRIEVLSSEIVPLLCLASSYCMIGLRDKLGDTLGSNLTGDPKLFPIQRYHQSEGMKLNHSDKLLCYICGRR